MIASAPSTERRHADVPRHSLENHAATGHIRRRTVQANGEGRAVNRTPGNECIKIVCRLRATTILQTVLAAAQLAAFGRVDTPEPNARSMYFQRVAVNGAGLTHKIVGHRRARQQQDHQYKGSAFAHDVAYQRLPQIARIEFWPVLEWL
jgi:hypothetical protein